MADTKITALTAISTNPVNPATFPIPMVDLLDTSMAASGTTKKVTVNQILGSGGTATLASATITGDLTVDTSTLKVDSTNNRVGIGTATPSDTLSVVGGNASNLLIDNGGQQYTQLTLQRNSALNSGGDILINGTASTMNIRMLAVGSMKFYTSPTAGSPVERYNIDDTGISTWSVAGTTAMTLNSTGLGIGVSPSAWSNPYKCVQLSGGSLSVYPTTDLYISQNAYNSGGWKRVAAGYASQYIQTNSEHRFLIAGTDPTVDSAIAFTQAMTLDASGNLLVGKTSSANTVAGVKLFTDSVDGGREYFTRQAGAASQTHVVFFESGGGVVGSISTTNVATAYNISSDYRLKQSVQPLAGGLARVNSLKPSTYKWNLDGSAGEGFIAHELAEVVPFAVSGQKDAVNEDGSIKIQGVDLSKIVPILVAAIQELTARVQTLEAR